MTIDDDIARLEERLAKMRAIKQVLSDPDCLRYVKQHFEMSGTGTEPTAIFCQEDGSAVNGDKSIRADRHPQFQGNSSLDRILSMFESQGNSPRTVSAMAAAAGVGESAVRQLITRNSATFEQVGKRGRERLFRVRKTGGET